MKQKIRKQKNKIIIGIKITNNIVVVLSEFFVSLAFNNIDIGIVIVVNIRIVSDNIEISICDFKKNTSIFHINFHFL